MTISLSIDKSKTTVRHFTTRNGGETFEVRWVCTCGRHNTDDYLSPVYPFCDACETGYAWSEILTEKQLAIAEKAYRSQYLD